MKLLSKDFLQSEFGIINQFALRSECIKKKVGACLIGILDSEFGPVYLGYGGPSEGTKCELNKEGLCPRKYMNWAQDGCWSIHAEQRALIQANFNLSIHLTWIMLVTHGPCDQCIKFMHHAGVSKVIYDIEYKTDYSKWEGKIEIISLKDYLKSLEVE